MSFKQEVLNNYQCNEGESSLESFLNALNNGDPVHYLISPSMSFDQKLLEGIEGIEHYELRSFWEILRVRRKKTFVTFISSEKISNEIFEHFVEVFNLTDEEISRIKFINCPRQNKELSLTKNILNNSKCIQEIKKSIKTRNVILECFVSTDDEKELARVLEVPFWHSHPQMNYFHTKSGNRFILGNDTKLPKGKSDLFSKESVIKALISLKDENPNCPSFMIKLNYGVSGQGNMKISLNSHHWKSLREREKKNYVELAFIKGELFNKSICLKIFEKRIIEEGAVVEEFVPGNIIDSPSAQLMVTPYGVNLISTHNQILDVHGQKFIGGEFPCNKDYKKEVSKIALSIGQKLRKQKVYGVTSVDFLISEINGIKECFVIELNIRKGGTTHPFMLSSFAIEHNGGFLDGVLQDRDKINYFYRSNDNFYPCRRHNVSSVDIIKKSKQASLVFNNRKRTGVIFHLLNAYSDFGKIGYTILAPTKKEIDEYEYTLNQVLGGDGPKVRPPAPL